MMSRDYGITLLLKTKYTKQSTMEIIARGAECGFEYVRTQDAIDNVMPPTHITQKELVDYIDTEMDMARKNNFHWNFLPCYFAHFGEKSVTLVVNEELGCLGLLLARWKGHWFSPTDVYQIIDFPKYIRLMLDITQNFSIVELKTYDSYRQEELVSYQKRTLDRDYGIIIELGIPYTKRVMAKIIAQGAQCGFVYVPTKDTLSMVSAPTSTAQKQLVDYIDAQFRMARKHDFHEEFLPTYFASFENKSVTFVVNEQQGCLRLLFTPWKGNWFLPADANEAIDFHKYIRLALDIVQDFPVFKLATYDSYRDAPEN